MAKKNEARGRVTLKCNACGEENYRTSKNKKNTPERLTIKKYCSRCQATVEHTEKKIIRFNPYFLKRGGKNYDRSK